MIKLTKRYNLKTTDYTCENADKETLIRSISAKLDQAKKNLNQSEREVKELTEALTIAEGLEE